MDGLDRLRMEIDRIDRDLVALFEERMDRVRRLDNTRGTMGGPF